MLRVVSEGAMRVIESVSPRVNLVAFEHALRIDAQRTAMREGELRRRDAPAPLLLPSTEAKCVSQDVAISGFAGLPAALAAAHAYESECQ